ncbi:4357_t:CDS:10 [Funneliformis geosporum]|nr:4357_t:CDS:10 [Funneliformis geosporum]
MVPTKILKDISVDLKYAIPPSNKESIVTICLKKDQLLLDVVRRFMNDNKIPCYLELSLLSVTESLMKESLRMDIENDKKIESDLEARRFRKNLVSKYKNYTVRYNTSPKEDNFPKAHNTLVHSPIPSIFDTLLQLEEKYKQAIMEIVLAHENEMEHIQDKHHKEIDEIVDRGSSYNNGYLVEKHLEYKQATLASELEDMKRTQKNEYCDFVVKLYEAHQRWIAEHQSESDPNWTFKLDGKDIVSEVISSLKKSRNELSNQLLRLNKGHGARSHHGSISSLSEVLSPVMPSPPSPMFSPVSSSFGGNGDDKIMTYFNHDDNPAYMKMINEIQDMGFHYDQAKVALEMVNWSMEQAVALLCEQLDRIDAQIANNTVLPPRRTSIPFASSPLKENPSSIGKSRNKSPRRPKLAILTKTEKKIWSPMSFFNQKQPTVSSPSTTVRRFSWLSRKVMDDDVNGNEPNLHLAGNTQMMESYTISLGNQVKSTHNLRLLVSDMDDLFKSSNDTAKDMAYRAQTAANLYSQNLTAIVLILTPRDWANYKLGKSANKAFFLRCRESTEFHFKDVESQLEAIERDFGRSEVQEGDFFITKHSNLPLVHVVFHLVIEFESITKSELTQKSRVMNGLRNILRTVDRFDIASMSLPFLLLPSKNDPFSDPALDENILYKRSELVLKCIRGFMIQNSRLPKRVSNEQEQEAKTVSFLLSNNASERQFHDFKGLLTRTFKTS